MRVADAYERCEQITRREAKNFAYGIRLLPGDKRRAMSAIYAMARRIDDVGDGDLPPDRKWAELARLRDQVGELAEGRVADPADPVLVGVGAAAARYPIPVAAFAEIIEGCELDVAGASFETPADTERYCRLVAGSVGRLSLGVFGTTDPVRAPKLADDLGVALQLTNILRDVVEDRQLGRVYLPASSLERFGCTPDLVGPPGAVDALIRHEVGRAESWYQRGLELLETLDGRSRACVVAMAGIYHRLLGRICDDPAAVLAGRVSLSGREKAWVAVRSLIGAAA